MNAAKMLYDCGLRQSDLLTTCECGGIKIVGYSVCAACAIRDEIAKRERLESYVRNGEIRWTRTETVNTHQG